MARLKRYGYHKKSGRKALPDDKALSKAIRFRPTTFDLFYQLREMINEDEANGIALLKFLLEHEGKIPELMHKIATTQFVHQRSEELVMAFKLLFNDVALMRNSAQKAIESGRNQHPSVFCVNNCHHFKQSCKTIDNLQSNIGKL